MEPNKYTYVVCDADNANVGCLMRVYSTREMAEKERDKYKNKYPNNQFIIRCVPVDFIDE